MKRAITALTLVCALMLSVVACQVYNPTNNETLYTAMRTEGAISWADYSKKYFDADLTGKCQILEEYESIRTLFMDSTKKEAYVKGIEALDKAYDEAVEKCKSAKEAYEKAVEAYEKAKGLKKAQKEKEMNEAFTKLNEAEEAVSKAYDAVCSDLKVLWDKEFDVLWDWNSKM